MPSMVRQFSAKTLECCPTSGVRGRGLPQTLTVQSLFGSFQAHSAVEYFQGWNEDLGPAVARLSFEKFLWSPLTKF
jgi:hypothetical protein